MRRKALAITFHLFIKPFGGDTVDFGKVFIQHNSLATQDIDRSFDPFYWDQSVFRHVLFCIAFATAVLLAQGRRLG